jgi:hypothetical protein
MLRPNGGAHTMRRLRTVVEMYSSADGEATRLTGMPPIFRFYAKLEPDPSSGCWNWMGTKSDDGYGGFWEEEKVLAHRFVYAFIHGPIGEKLEIHHHCRNRSCANPEHLIALSHLEHMLLTRRPTCRRGHLKSGSNLYVNPKTGNAPVASARGARARRRKRQP